jgi:hypothetical protein
MRNARYVTSGFPMLFVLAAHGFYLTRRTVPRPWRQTPSAILAACLLSQAAAGVPHLLDQIESNHGDVESVLPKVVRDYGITNAILFMDGVNALTNRPYGNKVNDFYATGFMRNDLDFDGDVVYARNRRHGNLRLIGSHPDRNLYLYRYERAVDRAYLYRVEVVEGERVLYEVEPKTRELLPAPPR